MKDPYRGAQVRSTLFTFLVPFYLHTQKEYVVLLCSWIVNNIFPVFRRFLLRPQIAISDDLRREVTRQIKDAREHLPQTVFDGVQREVEAHMSETTYPSFLKSEIYLQYLRQQVWLTIIPPGKYISSIDSHFHKYNFSCTP